MANDGAPTFGLWYHFRRQLPLTRRFEAFYAGCPPFGERPGFSSARLPEHHLVDDGYMFEART